MDPLTFKRARQTIGQPDGIAEVPTAFGPSRSFVVAPIAAPAVSVATVLPSACIVAPTAFTRGPSIAQRSALMTDASPDASYQSGATISTDVLLSSSAVIRPAMSALITTAAHLHNALIAPELTTVGTLLQGRRVLSESLFAFATAPEPDYEVLAVHEDFKTVIQEFGVAELFIVSTDSLEGLDAKAREKVIRARFVAWLARLLRAVNRAICKVYRAALKPQFTLAYAVVQRSWYARHGAHPPDSAASQHVPCSLPGGARLAS